MEHAFGLFDLHTDQRRLLRAGIDVEIGSRAFDVLVCLIQSDGKVVAKDELLRTAWPGVFVEENNLSVQISALRKLLGANSITTVSGRGYKFTVPVETRAAPPHRGMPQEPPGIAMLPLHAISDHPRAALLAAGLTADVIALLARVPGFRVISRGSTLALRPGQEDLPRLAREMAVRYFVEGTLRLQGDAVQVVVQLTDAIKGNILWSGTLEMPLATAEDLQEGIARSVIAQLQPELTRAEIQVIRRQRGDSLPAWSCYHQAVSVLTERGWCEAAVLQARVHLRQAIEADPGFGLPHAYYAVLTALAWRTALLPAGDARLIAEEVQREVDLALEVDPRSADVLGYAGCALSDVGRHEPALYLLQEAVTIDPSNSQAHVSLGAALASLGRTDEGIPRMRLGLRTSPRDRRVGLWTWALASKLLQAGRSEEAVDEARQAFARDHRLFLAPLTEAAGLVCLKRPIEALTRLDQARRLRPALTLDDIARCLHPKAAEDLRQHWNSVT